MSNTSNSGKHKWAFAPRFRRRAFGWRSGPAIQRIKEAVSEIRTIARRDAMLAAEGAVVFFEKISPALEQVDGSSGAVGAAVNRAIDALVPVVASAPADAKTRDRWLERLWNAHQADDIPYIESLGDHWGVLCASTEAASAWADRIVGIVKLAWSPDPNLRGYFHGTSACLSALYSAGRYDELLELLKLDRTRFWTYQRWGVRALAATGRGDEAIRFAESCRGPYTS